MTTPRVKRVGLNPKQLEVMEQIRCLSDNDVAKGARIAKKKLGLKKCYPVLDTSLDAELFHPNDIAALGWSETTVTRYMGWFLGIAKKKDEANKDARTRFTTRPHPFAPLVYDANGKVGSKWAGVDWQGTKAPPRLVSERLLLFLVLGLAIVKGTEKQKAAKKAARHALWKSLGILPATVVPISEDDELVFWNTVTTPLEDPTQEVIQPSLSFPTSDAVDEALNSFGASPVNGGVGSNSAELASFLEGIDDEEDGIPESGEDLILQGLQMLQQGVHRLLEETRAIRTQNDRTAQNQPRLAQQKRELDAKKKDLDAREARMREKEAVLAQVLRVTESLRTHN